MKKCIGFTIAVLIFVGAATMSNASALGQGASVQAERLTVTVPVSYRQDQRVILGTEPLGAPVLQQRVRQLMETRAQKTVFLRADRDITWGEVLEVMDLLKAAGVDQVALTSN